jgi:hypothetical protein
MMPRGFIWPLPAPVPVPVRERQNAVRRVQLWLAMQKSPKSIGRPVTLALALALALVQPDRCWCRRDRLFHLFWCRHSLLSSPRAVVVWRLQRQRLLSPLLFCAIRLVVV